MDVHTPKQRSYNMSRIKGRDTKLELLVRSTLHRLGYRFRKNKKDLPGKPDVVLRRHNLSVFIHGCFWHSHECKLGMVKISTRKDFWDEKRKKTKVRDQKNREDLVALGWNVIEIWECELKKAIKVDKVEDFLLERLNLPRKLGHKARQGSA
jgi:DNA mismatch endonuclease (patch repair protein)